MKSCLQTLTIFSSLSSYSPTKYSTQVSSKSKQPLVNWKKSNTKLRVETRSRKLIQRKNNLGKDNNVYLIMIIWKSLK